MEGDPREYGIDGGRKKQVGCCLLTSNTAFSRTPENTKAKILLGQHLIQIQQ